MSNYIKANISPNLNLVFAYNWEIIYISNNKHDNKYKW